MYVWYGIWIRYILEGFVKELFCSFRYFEGNFDKIEIYYLNKYIYVEDNVKEESWIYN